VALIDQTAHPERLEVIETDDVERVAQAIRRLEVGGAPAIAVAAAYALALAAFRSPATCADGVMADLETASRLLAAARPTATDLCRALDRMMAFARRRIASGTEGFPEAMLAEAERVADREFDGNRTRAGAEGGEGGGA